MYNEVYRIFKYLVLSFLLVGCKTQKLLITNDYYPDSLGIHLVNNAHISNDDWNYFTSATDSFIIKYNAGDYKFKLYSTNLDSNSVRIDILKNEYVTKKQQDLGVLYTLAGIATPIMMIAAQAPIVVFFWYIPTNYTKINKSLSYDLDRHSYKIPLTVKTHHHFENIDRQKAKQKDAYSQFLYHLFNDLGLEKKMLYPNKNVIYSDNYSNFKRNINRKCSVDELNQILLEENIDTSKYYKRIINELSYCSDVEDIQFYRTNKFIGIKMSHNFNERAMDNFRYKVGYWIYFNKEGGIEKEIMYDVYEKIIFKKEY